MTMKMLAVSLSSAALMIAFVNCGGGSSTNGSGKACQADSDCDTSKEICHPLAKICVAKCTKDTDCPKSAPHCGALTAPATSSQFCQCGSDTDCGGGTGSTAICGTEDKICETKCGSSADCQGRQCNTTTGQCMTAASCSQQNPCSGTNVCNMTTGQCEAPKTCSSTNAQPDTCDYGQFCSGSSCAIVAAPNCANFTSSTHANGWTVGSTAPVIYSMTPVSGFPATSTNGFCGTGTFTRFKFHVKAYWTAGTFPAADFCGVANSGSSERTLEQNYHLVDLSGNEISSAQTAQGLCTTNSGHDAEFDLNYCAPSGTATYSAGIHFYVSGASGNEYCATEP